MKSESLHFVIRLKNKAVCHICKESVAVMKNTTFGGINEIKYSEEYPKLDGHFRTDKNQRSIINILHSSVKTLCTKISVRVTY